MFALQTLHCFQFQTFMTVERLATQTQGPTGRLFFRLALIMVRMMMMDVLERIERGPRSSGRLKIELLGLFVIHIPSRDGILPCLVCLLRC
jgi:hypothetical protein